MNNKDRKTADSRGARSFYLQIVIHHKFRRRRDFAGLLCLSPFACDPHVDEPFGKDAVLRQIIVILFKRVKGFVQRFGKTLDFFCSSAERV